MKKAVFLILFLFVSVESRSDHLVGNEQLCPKIGGKYVCTMPDGGIHTLTIHRTVSEANTAVYFFDGFIYPQKIISDHNYHSIPELASFNVKGNCGGGALGINGYGIDPINGNNIVRDIFFEKSGHLAITVTGFGITSNDGALKNLLQLGNIICEDLN